MADPSRRLAQQRQNVLDSDGMADKDALQQYQHYSTQIFEDDGEIKALAVDVGAYAVTHGIIMAHNPPGVMHAPLSLLPSYVPVSVFEMARDIAPEFNTLIDRVSRDYDFLKSTLKDAAKVDDFVRRQLDVMDKVNKEGEAQDIRLGMHRSDYMVHAEEKEDGQLLKTPMQVELNTIAASFACVTAQIGKMHKHMVTRMQTAPLKRSKPYLGTYDPKGLRENNAIKGLAKALATATRAHSSYKDADSNSSVLMVVQPDDANSADQRMLEYSLWEDYNVPMVRATLAEIDQRAKVDAVSKTMKLEGSTIAVVYFRAGYTPDDFPTEREWDAQLLIERTNAIKCPCMAYQLAGTKKVQQQLAQPGVVERFVPEASAKRIRACFAGLWGLEHEDEQTRAVIADAIEKPGTYVLKPQREGGGNNMWGQEIVDKLSTASTEERSAFILMQRIMPMTYKAALMKNGVVSVVDCVHELGIYQTYLGNGKDTLLNEFCGTLLRTKQFGVDEGGVASGYSVVNSPYVI